MRQHEMSQGTFSELVHIRRCLNAVLCQNDIYFCLGKHTHTQTISSHLESTVLYCWSVNCSTRAVGTMA